jgi:hypothetical protein
MGENCASDESHKNNTKTWKKSIRLELQNNTETWKMKVCVIVESFNLEGSGNG